MDSSRTRALWIFALIATLGLTGIVACGGDDRMTVPDLGPPERVGHAKR